MGEDMIAKKIGGIGSVISFYDISGEHPMIRQGVLREMTADMLVADTTDDDGEVTQRIVPYALFLCFGPSTECMPAHSIPNVIEHLG